jgi:hypothetical protein
LTLDDDVVTLLEQERRRRKARWRDIVNEVLREGLTRPRRTASRKPRRFRTRTVSLGRCLVGSLDDVTEALTVGARAPRDRRSSPSRS